MEEGREGRKEASKQVRQPQKEGGRWEGKEGERREGGKEREKQAQGERKEGSVINSHHDCGRKRLFKLTNESRLCQLKGFGCVQAGKGDQMKTSVHGVVHSHNTYIPV